MKISTYLLILLLMMFSACSDDDPEIPQEEELITTLRYTLIPSRGGPPIVLSFSDSDGDGGNAPVINTSPLQANETYIGSIVVLNESVSPTDDITIEIAVEAMDHQFFFSSSISDLAISYGDSDINGNPLGLVTELSTGGPGTGSLTITLRHEPDKEGMGVSDGNIANAGGETDIEVTFNVQIE
jgi:hypothetical protein